MKNPAVDLILGLHVNPEIPAGKIAVRDGALMSGVLEFDIEVVGKGGHGAQPDRTRDPIIAGTAIVQHLQTIASRRLDPFEPVVVTVGKIVGGSARNVIPEECKLSGTARALNHKTLGRLRREIRKIAVGTAKAMGCRADITFHEGYPPLQNDSTANELIVRAAYKTIGRGKVVSLTRPYLAGEDFARYLEQAKGAMFHLGISNPKIGAVQGWHHPAFIADEECLGVGIKILTQALVEYLI
jgi:amidohydrolase